MQVNIVEELPNDDEQWKQYAAVVVSGACVDVTRANDACRAVGVKFVLADAPGVFGAVFCDFGAEHDVLDASGEPTDQWLVAHVSDTNPCRVEVLAEGPRLRFVCSASSFFVVGHFFIVNCWVFFLSECLQIVGRRQGLL